MLLLSLAFQVTVYIRNIHSCVLVLAFALLLQSLSAIFSDFELSQRQDLFLLQRKEERGRVYAGQVHGMKCGNGCVSALFHRIYSLWVTRPAHLRARV